MELKDLLVVFNSDRNQSEQLSRKYNSPIIRNSTTRPGEIAVTYGKNHIIATDMTIYPSTLTRADAEKMSLQKNTPIFRESSIKGRIAVTIGHDHMLMEPELVKQEMKAETPKTTTMQQQQPTNTQANQTADPITPLANRAEAEHAAKFLKKAIFYRSSEGGFAVRTPIGESFKVTSYEHAKTISQRCGFPLANQKESENFRSAKEASRDVLSPITQTPVSTHISPVTTVEQKSPDAGKKNNAQVNLTDDLTPLANRAEAEHAAVFLKRSIVYKSRDGGFAVRTPTGDSFKADSLEDANKMADTFEFPRANQKEIENFRSAKEASRDVLSPITQTPVSTDISPVTNVEQTIIQEVNNSPDADKEEDEDEHHLPGFGS